MHMKKYISLITKSLFILSLSLSVFSCTKEEPEEPIDTQSTLPGTWICQKKVILELEAGSTWRYNEVSSDFSDDWANIPYTFGSDGYYLIEYRASDNYIVKYNDQYTLSNDTIHFSNLNEFPCHDAIVSFNSTSSMIFTTHGTKNGTKIKTEYHFFKESTQRAPKAFNSITASQSKSYIFSAVNHSHIASFKIESVSATTALLIMSNNENITLSSTNSVLVFNGEGYFAKSVDHINNNDTTLFYFDSKTKTLNSADKEPSVINNVGEILFWEK